MLRSIPPDDEGDPALASHGGDIVRLAGPTLRWVGYLSTTGVYGDRGGAWVDERSEPGPGSPRARRRLDAERGWQEMGRTHRIPVHVFRLPGIYGPGRSQFDARSEEHTSELPSLMRNTSAVCY